MKLNNIMEMQDFRNHSGHRQTEESTLLTKVGKFDEYFMHDCPNQKAKAEWDRFTETMLDGDEATYWSDLSEDQLEYVYHGAIDMMNEFNLEYPQNF